MKGVEKRSRAAMLWTGVLLAAVLVTVLVATDYQRPALAQGGVQVSKEASMGSIWASDLPTTLIYTVTFSNSNGTDVLLEVVTDTLPTGFTFITVENPKEWPWQVVANEPELLWEGPITLPATTTLSLIYSVEVTDTVPAATAPYTNNVRARTVEGLKLGPASASLVVQPGRYLTFLPLIGREYRFARLEIARSVAPEHVSQDEVVRYTAEIHNVGGTTGQLTEIRDTLPAGFDFLHMTDDSEVQTLPQTIGGVLVWDDGWEMSPSERLLIEYEMAAAAAPGTYASSMILKATEANVPGEPALVNVTIDAPITGLDAANNGPTVLGQPTTLSAWVTGGTNVVYSWTFGDGTTGAGAEVTHTYAAAGTYTAQVTAENATGSATDTTEVVVKPATLIDEDFNDGWEDWTAFLNYHRLGEGQWYWGPHDGVDGSGGLTQDAYAVDGKEAEDALVMWEQPGAEDWTDYRIEGKLILRTAHYPHGFWVRGQHELKTDKGGGWVTGYYIMVGGSPTGKTHFVSLKQLQTIEDCWDEACNHPENLYDFNNPHELTMTKKDGALPRYVWHTLAVEVRGANIKVWLNDELYIDYDDNEHTFLTGTVGLKTMLADTVTFDDIVVTPLD